jgi:hypothetical protein
MKSPSLGLTPDALPAMEASGVESPRESADLIGPPGYFEARSTRETTSRREAMAPRLLSPAPLTI